MDGRQEQIDGTGVLWREVPARAGAAPVVYLHGAPGSSGDLVPFLERTGGYAPDLPGFGRSDKPAHFDYSIGGYTTFLHEYVDRLGLERFSLVMHDWGAVGLALAQAIPDRVERLVAIDVVPLLPGFRWHRAARIWRTPLAGELFMGFSFRWNMRLASREWLAAEGPAPDAMVDELWRHWDHGTQRAILKLFRSAPPAKLAAAGERLGAVEAPALVVHGADDPYVPLSFAQALADALGGRTHVEVVESARHWPWIDRPEVVDRVADFLLGPLL
jgi:pimeloyl-ACP methyl ester carboxylesterase